MKDNLCVVLVPDAVSVVKHPFTTMTNYCLSRLYITAQLPLNVKPNSQLNKNFIATKAVQYLCRNSHRARKWCKKQGQEVSN
jgi:hypothetical protein